MLRPECSIEPTGASPVRASAVAPGSRPQPLGENPTAERGVKSLEKREQARGLQHQVNSAASSNLQRESRAAHITAKATSGARTSAASAPGLPGVWEAARAQGSIGNRRDPSWQPTSGKDRPHKPKVKLAGAKRESEGVVVPAKDGQHNPSSGKGPHFGHAGQAGKRKGMAARPNYPGGRESADNVRQLQDKLCAAAKQSPRRRFHALYDRICRSDVLQEAWRRVRANRGAAGVDGTTLAEVESYGVARMISELQTELQQGRYRPSPVLRRYIPKPDGGKRPLGIPTVKDRVAQQAAKLVLEPIFEADFSNSSYGYRPGKSQVQAMEVIRTSFIKGYTQALEVDIADFFGSLDHDLLMKLLQERISDRRVLKLVKGWLKAGVLEEGASHETISGTPQGGVILPLLSNIYLNLLDQIWEKEGTGILVRFADDAVIMCRTRKGIERAEETIRFCLSALGLEANQAKTRKVDLREGREGFDFLGCHFHARVSGRLLEQGVRKYYLHRWPSTRSMNRVRRRVRALTNRRARSGIKDIREVIEDLNPVLRGWGNYFRTGNAADQFLQIDQYVWRRLIRLLVRKHGGHPRPVQVKRWTNDWFRAHGLHRLRGTIRYPGAA
jgi:RNA-directed DNA polymerase